MMLDLAADPAFALQLAATDAYTLSRIASRSFTGAAEALGVPTRFIPHNKTDAILASFGLDAAGIASSLRSLL